MRGGTGRLPGRDVYRLAFIWTFCRRAKRIFWCWTPSWTYFTFAWLIAKSAMSVKRAIVPGRAEWSIYMAKIVPLKPGSRLLKAIYIRPRLAKRLRWQTALIVPNLWARSSRSLRKSSCKTNNIIKILESLKEGEGGGGEEWDEASNLFQNMFEAIVTPVALCQFGITHYSSARNKPLHSHSATCTVYTAWLFNAYSNNIDKFKTTRWDKFVIVRDCHVKKIITFLSFGSFPHVRRSVRYVIK